MEKFRVLVADAIEEECLAILEKSARVEYHPKITPEELLSKITEFEVLIVRSRTKVTSEVLKKAENLKVIGRPGVGVDNIDVKAASKKAIVVVNTPGATTRSVAEYTLGLMILLSRNFYQACRSLKEGRWEKKKFKGFELSGKTLGIVGLGKIGAEVAVLAQNLGMKVIAFSPTVARKDPGRARKLSVSLVTLAKLFQLADYICVNEKLTNKTRGLIGKREFAKAKSSAYFINVSRGGIVDEKALLWAVENGKLAGAVVDVYAQEPPFDNPLLKNDKIITLPHLGGQTIEGQKRAGVEIAEKVIAYLRGEEVDSIVNLKELQND